jgi:hypothetical protein
MGQRNEPEAIQRGGNVTHVDGPPAEVLSIDEDRRTVYDLLGNETRYYVLTAIVAHPEHLPSLYQLATFAGVARSTISRETIPALIDAGIVDSYDIDDPDNPDANSYPTTFYGFTARGIDRLDAVGFFETARFQRGLYHRLSTDETWDRHDAADRPALPADVESKLEAILEPEREDVPDAESIVPEPPADADAGAGDLGDLFE